MPVPEGIISTSTGPAEAVQEVVPVAEAIKIIKEEDAELLERLKEADAEEAVEVSTIAVEELTKDLVDVELPAGLDTE